jgi:hypothetical protein|tara:strand:- start:170 stop:649 length:480 start_codon:yes stop_codon:yes gene_type:complete
MELHVTDGGRAAAGIRGAGGDCVTRAVAIATQQPYDVVYAALSHGSRSERVTRGARAKTGASNGVHTKRKWFKDYMAALGWTWTPTMGIGTGCTVHLSDGELPMGRLIVSVSKHYTTVIDGVIHDTHDPQRGDTFTYDSSGSYVRLGGGRCVYGYWSQA